MSRRRWALMTAAGVLLWSAPALGVEGRYLGTFQRTVNGLQEDFIRQLLDVRTYGVIPGGADLNVSMSLTWGLRPGEANQSLLQSRFFGDARKDWWRVTGQFVPWQDTRPGPATSRRRDIQVGFQANPHNPFSAAFNYNRADRETGGGSAWDQDGRLGLAYKLPHASSYFTYRRIQTGGESNSYPVGTNEWRGGVSGTRAWRTFSADAAYDANLTQTDSEVRGTTFYTQRVSLGGGWRPIAPVRVSAGGYTRWGKSEVNGFDARNIDEKALTASASYLTRFGLEGQLLRSYTETLTGNTPLVNDYLQAKLSYSRLLLPRVLLQGSATYNTDLREGGAPPRNSIYAAVDGEVRRGLGGRVEYRVATSSNRGFSETLTRTLVQLRTHPIQSTRFFVTWWTESVPETPEVTRQDDQWEFQLTWEPTNSVNLTGSYRRLDGEGLVLRQDRFGTVSLIWRTGDRTQLSYTFTRRVSLIGSVQVDDRTSIAGFSFWLPREFRLRLGWTRLYGDLTAEANTYNLALEKAF